MATYPRRSFSRQPSTSGIAHYDQAALTPSLPSDISTMDTASHTAHTTVDSVDVDGAGEGTVYSSASQADIGRFLREIRGRRYNTLNDAYPFPADEQEWDRLGKKHLADFIVFNGLVPCPPELVDAVLAPTETSTPKRILDVGCGTGAWSLEMAKLFPHAEVIGIDLAPVPVDPTSFPSNLRYEIDDVNHGLSHLYDQFDLVHSRSATAGFTEPGQVILELQRCVKPGGLLILIEGDRELWDDNRRKIPMARVPGDEDVSGVSDQGSWFQRVFWEAIEASSKGSKSGPNGGEIIDLGLWDSPFCDPETAGGGTSYIPIGTWSTGSLEEMEMMRYAGILFRKGFREMHRAFHTILRNHGIPQETLNEWSARADEELESTKFRMHARYRYSWARRRSEEGGPAPALPALNEDGKVLSVDPPRVKYPLAQRFWTKEEARAALEARMATVGEWPTPLVKRTGGQV